MARSRRSLFASGRPTRYAGRSSRKTSCDYQALEPRQLMAGMPIISEFLASNSNTLDDGNGNSSDWIEIFNAGTDAIDLAGWALTDDAGDLSKWVFPSTAPSQLGAGEYLIVFASGDNVPDAAGNLHTNFSLSAGGEYLALVERTFSGDTVIGETVVSEFNAGGVDFPEQFTDISFGLQSGVSSPRYFDTPTPGEANGTGFTGVVSDTNFSIDRGFYSSPFTVDVTSDTFGGTVVYTTDGSEPTLNNGTQVTAGANATPTASVFIDTTTTLRAAAFRNGFLSTNVDTHTYLFLDDVIRQSNSPEGFPADWNGAVADYELDPEIVNDPAYSSDILAGLRDLPSLTLSSSVDNIFGAEGGIYANPTNEDLEVPVSAEYILADGTTGFQIDAGLKVAGGASRLPERSPKHSLSLRFRSIYGASRLNYDLFEDSPVDSFNSLQLRAVYNNSFIHFNDAQRNRGTLIRDQFIRDSLLALGHEDAQRGNFANLYINGLFWGVYNVHERGESSHFAEYNGGDSDDFDALNGGSAVDGTIDSFNQLRAAARSGDWDEIQQRLDVDNFIDWTIIQSYGGNRDLRTNGNWRAAGGGSANAKWRFYAWDSERTLEGPQEGAPGTITDATGLFDELVDIEEFRVRFSDRVQQHFFNGGALTPEATAARWNARVDELNLAIVGETARWGDYRRDVVGTSSADLYERNDQWLAEIDRLVTDYFPTRSEFVVNEFSNLNLFSTISAPTFNIDGSAQNGGQISGGNSLTITGNSGQIYFTLNGSDPRAEGGGINGTLFTSPVQLDATTTVRARTFVNGQWSPLSQATFITAESSLVVSEINYHPADPSTPSELAILGVDADEFEFIELLNTNPTESINLEGVRLAGAVDYTFGNVVLEAGERIVVVENQEAFAARYGTSINVAAGTWSGGLSNSGETLELLNAADAELASISYEDSDPWAISADGFGATLVLVDPFNTPEGAFGKYYSWRGSSEFNGTPGAASAAPSGVVINEILAHTDSGLVDSIELFNPTDNPINLSGAWLSDSGLNPFQYQIPANTIIAAGGYLVFDESDFNPTPGSPQPNHFALNASEGEEVWLTRGSASTGVTSFEAVVEFGATFNGESLGRLPDGSGRLARLSSPSLGSVNVTPRLDTLLISEVNYHPANPTAAALAIEPTLIDNDLEFVEIHNPTAATVDLTNWRLRGQADFNFPAGDALAPGETRVLVTFDPADAANSSRVEAFRVHYGISSAVVLLGPLDSNLSNSSGRISLQGPDSPPASDPTAIPHVLVDEVLYDDLAPWANADGTGLSLHRGSADEVGNLASNWLGLTPTPGVADLAPSVPLVVSTTRDEGGVLVRPDLLSTLVINFDRDVEIDINDFRLFNDTLGGTVVDTAGITLDYDPVTFTATWGLDQLDLPAAFYTYELDGSSIFSAASGVSLDGDSDGAAGGGFAQPIYVAIPGDLNLDGDVDFSDVSGFSQNGDNLVALQFLGTSTGATWAQGDLNGDGDVDLSEIDFALGNVGDIFTLRQFLGSNVLPPVAVAGATGNFVSLESESPETFAVAAAVQAQPSEAPTAESDFAVAQAPVVLAVPESSIVVAAELPSIIELAPSVDVVQETSVETDSEDVRLAGTTSAETALSETTFVEATFENAAIAITNVSATTADAAVATTTAATVASPVDGGLPTPEVPAVIEATPPVSVNSEVVAAPTSDRAVVTTAVVATSVEIPTLEPQRQPVQATVAPDLVAVAPSSAQQQLQFTPVAATRQNVAQPRQRQFGPVVDSPITNEVELAVAVEPGFGFAFDAGATENAVSTDREKRLSLDDWFARFADASEVPELFLV